jgi:hypothetical protein
MPRPLYLVVTLLPEETSTCGERVRQSKPLPLVGRGWGGVFAATAWGGGFVEMAWREILAEKRGPLTTAREAAHS